MEESFKQFQKIPEILLSPEELLERKEEYLKKLKVLRFDYIEEFPSEILQPEMPNYHKYKCRTNFFNNISTTIMVLQSIELINSVETKKECKDFIKFCDSIGGTTRRYTQKDIDIANKMLDSLIKELS